MSRDFDELGELIAETDTQTRTATSCREAGDLDGEIFALTLAEALLSGVIAQAGLLKAALKESKQQIVRDASHEDRSRRMAVGTLQLTARLAGDDVSEGIRAFAVGFSDGRLRLAIRTTEDDSYLLGHRLGLSTLEN